MMALPPLEACGYCKPPSHQTPNPPKTKHPPKHGKGYPVPYHKPPRPPVVSPPVTKPPPSTGNPPSGGGGILPPIGGTTPPGSGGGGGGILPPIGGGGGGGILPPIGGGGGGGGILPPIGGGGAPGTTPPSTSPTCPINALKLGLCVDVLSGLVHIGIGNPVENACCPVIQGLLEIEAALCLCTTIRLKLLNLNIILPIALQALITCGKNPPPGFVCPPLN
ncbi:hypothetical protein Sjap_020401 [Stephania japonica]|uniref:Hydrophobic seed protein domain-containing protein n=1 Tax=Stephania japonica TaxID=461633 RepID=A0AAP0F3E0_9MAGN